MNTIPLLARLLSVVLIATLSLQSFAAQLPDLGDAASGSLSPAMEKKIGEEALAASTSSPSRIPPSTLSPCLAASSVCTQA